MHAEAPPSDPSAVRWAVPEAELPCGRLVSAPGALGELLHGAIRLAIVEPHGVTVWLSQECSWRDWGAQVQSALSAALGSADTWVVHSDRDDVLVRVVTDVLAGAAGDYVRSHGGTVELRHAADDEVEIELAGACAGCPAVSTTVRDRIETAVRARYPALRRVTDTRSRTPAGEGTRFLLWPRLRKVN